MIAPLAHTLVRAPLVRADRCRESIRMQRVGRSNVRGGARRLRADGARGGAGKRLTLVCLLVAFGSAGCGGPLLVFPGGELSGEVVSEPVDDWSFAGCSHKAGAL